MALLARLGSMVGRGEKGDSSSQSDTGDLRVTMVLAPRHGLLARHRPPRP